MDIARLAGRIDLVEGRLAPLEKWKTISEDFHMEMRGRWDHFDGMQEAEAKIQEQRHQSNATKLNIITILVLIATAIIGFMGVVVAYNEVHHSKTEPLVTHQVNSEELAQMHQYIATE